jgi:thiol:disulfide interchange protein
MKKLIYGFLGLALGAQLAFATETQWLTSVPEAEAKAKAEHKLVFLNFTGSDWCEACKVLDSEVLDKTEFAAYASTNLVLVTLDYPLSGKQPKELVEANDQLQKKYNIEGFPTLIVLKPDGTVVWSHIGIVRGGLKATISQLEEARKKAS